MTEEKSKRTRILIPVLVVFAVVGAGFGGYAAAGGPGDDEASDEQSETPEEGAVVEVGELTVSLAGTESHYARVGLAVVLADGASEEEVTERFPLLKDAALLVVADRAPDDLRSREGLEDLRTSLTDIARDIYTEGEVLRVILLEAIVT